MSEQHEKRTAFKRYQFLGRLIGPPGAAEGAHRVFIAAGEPYGD
ncbi:MAG: hypothetical protein ACXVIY_00090 [Mucilaginibacter sp.]